MAVSSLSFTIHSIDEYEFGYFYPKRSVFRGGLAYETSAESKVVGFTRHEGLEIDMNTFSLAQQRRDVVLQSENVIGAYVDKSGNVCHMRANAWKDGICQHLMVAGVRCTSVFPEEVKHPPFDDESVVNFLCNNLYCIIHYTPRIVFPFRLEYGKRIVHLCDRDRCADLGLDMCPPRKCTKSNQEDDLPPAKLRKAERKKPTTQ